MTERAFQYRRAKPYQHPSATAGWEQITEDDVPQDVLDCWDEGCLTEINPCLDHLRYFRRKVPQ